MRGCSGGGACVVTPGVGGCAGLLWGHAWLLPRGACMVAPRGGMRGCSGGCAWLLWGGAWLLWGVHVWLLLGGGACMGYDEIRRYDQWAGGTHPTGMHSCSHRSLCVYDYTSSSFISDFFGASHPSALCRNVMYFLLQNHNGERRQTWDSSWRWLCYRPQRSCGKVIFSQACVKNSVHRGVSLSQHAPQDYRSHDRGGLCPRGDLCSGRPPPVR